MRNHDGIVNQRWPRLNTYPADWERPGSPRGADIWASIEELKSKLKMKASLVAKKMLVAHRAAKISEAGRYDSD